MQTETNARTLAELTRQWEQAEDNLAAAIERYGYHHRYTEAAFRAAYALGSLAEELEGQS